MAEYIEIPDFWHHINLRKKQLDLSEIDKRVLFAEYNSKYGFFKFVGHIAKDNWVVYPSGRMKKVSDTKSKLWWSELPEDPEI